MLSVVCSNSSLATFPITLNPHLTSLAIHNTQVHTSHLTSPHPGDDLTLPLTQVAAITDGLRFYEALHSLDLATNTIATLQDRAFSYQVRKLATTLVG